MKICMICEGSYPYVAGGVASWVQMVCSEYKDMEFGIWSIATSREEMSEYKYVLPENVTEVRTIYLSDMEFKGKNKRHRLLPGEKEVFQKLVTGTADEIDWKAALEFIKKYQNYLVDLLMGTDFYHICLEQYKKSDTKTVFNHYLWNCRGMYFPFMHALSGEIMEADLYHAVSTGYAGILGSSASYISGKPLLLSEHGIYTREREEDIIRSDWVDGDFKELWIQFFKKLSLITYHQARTVTSLFEVNKTLQIELGCPKEKIQIIPNGVDTGRFQKMQVKNLLNHDEFQIGTVLRVVPIKDVKTMLLAFSYVKETVPNARLNILGNYDEDPSYYEECLELVKTLGIEDVIFYGQVNINDYLPEIDLLLLSSISEGQPLAIIEGMAAGIPFVCTNVGDVRGLLEGTQGDEIGLAGLVVPVMDSQAMAKAVTTLANDPKKRMRMGKNGKKRVEKYYKKEYFMKTYRDLYEELGKR